MKFTLISFAIFATALAGGSGGKSCKSDQTPVRSKNGNGGLISLGNIAGGALGDNCSGGDVYCCDTKDVEVRYTNLLSRIPVLTMPTERSRQPGRQRPVLPEPRSLKSFISKMLLRLVPGSNPYLVL